MSEEKGNVQSEQYDINFVSVIPILVHQELLFFL